MSYERFFFIWDILIIFGVTLFMVTLDDFFMVEWIFRDG